MKANLFASVLSSLILCASGVQAKVIHPQLPPPSTLQKSSEKIDLNKADARILVHSVKGIGQKRAEAIVKYRGVHGRLNSLDDLAKVPGLGQKFVKDHLKELQQVFTIN